MFIEIKISSTGSGNFLFKVKDTQCVFNMELTAEDNNWQRFLSLFYDEYEKRNMNPIANMLMLMKWYRPSFTNVIMSFLKSKTDQKIIDKYMILL